MRSGRSRREILTGAMFSLCFLVVLGGVIPTAWAQQSRCPGLVTELASVGITVADMDRSVEFYSKVLSFEKVFILTGIVFLFILPLLFFLKTSPGAAETLPSEAAHLE